MQQPDTVTSEELYFEAVDLAARLADAIEATSRWESRHYRLSLALDHARQRVRRRRAAAYGVARLPVDVRATEELP